MTISILDNLINKSVSQYLKKWVFKGKSTLLCDTNDLVGTDRISSQIWGRQEGREREVPLFSNSFLLFIGHTEYSEEPLRSNVTL